MDRLFTQWCKIEYAKWSSEDEPYKEIGDEMLRAGTFILVPSYPPAVITPLPEVEEDSSEDENDNAIVPDTEQPPNQVDPDAFVNGVNSHGCVDTGTPVAMVCLDETMGPWTGHQDFSGVTGPPCVGCVMHMIRKPKELGVEYISAA
jgi:hypothetical protein